MNKSADILYLFDFDGTLLGNDNWEGVIKNNMACIKGKPIINPSMIDFRWAILTGRPRVDKLFVWMCSHLKGLHPCEIITQDSLFYPKNCTSKMVYDYKVNVIKSILSGKRKLKFTTRQAERIFYIDNDLNCISYMNSVKNGYSYQAISGSDFCKGDFEFYM